MTFDLQTVVMAGAIAIIAVWNAWKAYSEHMGSRKQGLKSNPHRCAEHAERLRVMEGVQGSMSITMARITERVKDAQGDIKEIKDEVKEIRSRL